MMKIECRNVTKRFGSKLALNKMSFTIEGNKITGLIGRNGVGKTTILKMIAGLIPPTEGELKVLGKSPFNNLFVSANTIFVDDQMKFPNSLNLTSILKIASTFYEKWDAHLANGLFDYFSLDPNQLHGNLSKGMKSTFNMIVGLASRSPITIFDEPTTGMDAAVRKDFYRALLKDYLAHPRTIIISSHHLDEIEDLIEDVLLMKDGKEHLHIPITELKEYAISVKGRNNVLQEWLQEKEVIYREEINETYSYVVVKNNRDEAEITVAQNKGLDVQPVRPSDICVYLTNKHKGGIDDVFK